MKHLITITFVLIACLTWGKVSAQAVVDSSDIYIKQTPGDSTAMPDNSVQFIERPVFNQNSIRSISLYYPEQDEWVTFSGNEDLQWGTSELIDGSEDISIETDAISRDSITADRGDAGRLAELLGSMINGQSGERNSEDDGSTSGTRVSADDETMNAFREAFEAVLQEENAAAQNSDERESDTVELPIMYGNVDGIVLDETRSKTGRDFYKAFYDAWSKSKGVENSVVRVAEKPGPGMASIVYVEVNYEEIFELRLRPGDQRTKQAGQVAAVQTLNYLKEHSTKTLTY
jgi:curli production assembly/transport component CsgE